MESFITTFHIDWKILIAQAINFAIIFAVLYFFALKPLSKLMKERENRIAGGLDDAKTNAELLKNTKKEYDEVLLKARAEANTIFQDGKRDAEAKKAEMLAKAQGEVESMIASGKKSLESEKAKMIEEAKTEIVSLVVAATEKILTDQADKSVIDKAVKKINHI